MVYRSGNQAATRAWKCCRTSVGFSFSDAKLRSKSRSDLDGEGSIGLKKNVDVPAVEAHAHRAEDPD
jgi:hypothetical protein